MRVFTDSAGMQRVLKALIMVVLLIGMSTCVGAPGDGGNGGDGSDDDFVDDGNPAPVTQGNWYRPAVDSTWQWQLQPEGGEGELNLNYDVDVYDIDLFDVPDSVFAELQSSGRRVTCYFSAGTYESFRDDADQFDPDVLGEPLDDHPTERWLDVRSENVRQIMEQRLDHAVLRGCDGVEPDNVDGYANDSGFDLSFADQITFNRFLANAAHERGLSVGLKNDLDQIEYLVEYFDFAVNEECFQYEECDVLTPFIDAGKPVFHAEYEDRFVTSAAERAALCEEAQELGLRTLVLPLDLDDSFRISCDENGQ